MTKERKFSSVSLKKTDIELAKLCAIGEAVKDKALHSVSEIFGRAIKEYAEKRGI